MPHVAPHPGPFTRIVTHNGAFHADDVTAVTLLSMLSPGAELLRTRNMHLVRADDVVVDVGGVYDPAAARYDHHFVGSPRRTAPGHSTTAFASAGMVWAAYGPTLLTAAHALPDLTQERLALLDSLWIAPLDAADTGDVPDGAPSDPLSEHLAAMNTLWTEMLEIEHRAGVDGVREDGDRRFRTTLALVHGPLRAAIREAATAPSLAVATCGILRERTHLIDLLATRMQESLGAIEAARGLVAAYVVARAPGETHITIPVSGVPWEQLIHDAEDEAHMPDPVLHVISHGTDGHEYVTCVSTVRNGYVPRAPFPADWAGLRDDAFDDASGLVGGVFTHQARFMAGWRTLEMAKAGAARAAGDWQRQQPVRPSPRPSPGPRR
jgi:uncharacterized UPF0160 family protein